MVAGDVTDDDLARAPYVRVMASRPTRAQPLAMLSDRAPGRLHLVLQRTGEEVFEPDYVADAPLVRFVAFGPEHRIFGWVRLRADRLTDLLNSSEELRLDDVEIESLETGATRSLDHIVIGRAELVAVCASGPRGDEAQRLRTRTQAVAIQAGHYLVAGHLHVVHGVDPVASAWSRPPMIPLTDAWIEYWTDGKRTNQAVGTIVVNRELAEWIRPVTDEDLVEGRLTPG